MNKLGSLFIVLALGCGSTSAPTGTPANTTAATPATPATVSELTWYEGDDLGMRLSSAGKLEMKSTHSEPGQEPVSTWKEAFTLTADGSVVREGKPFGQLGLDGTFTFADGTKAEFQIDGDALKVGDKQISIGADGMIGGTNPKMRPMRVEGATTPEAKRTALLAFGLAFVAVAPPASPPPKVSR